MTEASFVGAGVTGMSPKELGELGRLVAGAGDRRGFVNGKQAVCVTFNKIKKPRSCEPRDIWAADSRFKCPLRPR